MKFRNFSWTCSGMIIVTFFVHLIMSHLFRDWYEIAPFRHSVHKYINNDFLEVAHSHSGFSSAFPGRIGIWKCFSFRRGEKRKKTTRRNKGIAPTANSTHTCRRRRDLKPGHIGGRRVLSTLCHPLFWKRLALKLWQNTELTPAILFWFFMSYALGREYNVIIRDSEPMRLLETPRSLSVYNILILRFLNRLIITKLTLKGSPSSTTQLNFCSGTLRLSGSYTEKLPITVPTGLFSRTWNIKKDLVT